MKADAGLCMRAPFNLCLYTVINGINIVNIPKARSSIFYGNEIK